MAIGSAAGIILIGQGKGHKTFLSHLEWSPLIASAWAVSILIDLGAHNAYF